MIEGAAMGARRGPRASERDVGTSGAHAFMSGGVGHAQCTGSHIKPREGHCNSCGVCVEFVLKKRCSCTGKTTSPCPLSPSFFPFFFVCSSYGVREREESCGKRHGADPATPTLAYTGSVSL